MNFFVDLYIILQLLLGAPLDVLVSPDQGLPVWYAPGLNPEAAAALDDMMLAAAEEDVMIWSYSDYRDYAYQQEVDRRESDRQPDRHRSYSAAAGHSEHQLGTAFDVAWPGLPVESREARNLELFDWLENNAHLYGFVISYPYKETVEWPYHNRWMPVVTEYIYEPWHIRYVGKSLAGMMLDDGYLGPQNPVLPQDYYVVWP